MSAAERTTSSATQLELPLPSNHPKDYTRPFTFPKKYSSLAKPRWTCFALFLFFAIPALGLALDNFQRVRNCSDHIFSVKDDPINHTIKLIRVPATPIMVRAWRILPIIEVLVLSAAVVFTWILDVWYPLTFISKPVGELCYFFTLIVFHTTTVAYTVYVLPQTLHWLTQTEAPFQRPNVEGEAWAMIACMLIQIIILTALCAIVLESTLRHRQQGRPEVLHHPTCRFDPYAPPPSALLTISTRRSPFSNYTTTAPSIVESGKQFGYSYSIHKSSQEIV